MALVESIHHGHLLAVDATGAPIATVGAADAVIFPRSSVKPFQAAVCLELMAACDAGFAAALTSADIAIGWASHLAAPGQLAAVRALLARAGLPEDVLSCPTARLPGRTGAERHRIAHGCSGKHALFAVTAHVLGLPLDPASLLAADGPLQTRILAGLEPLLGPFEAIAVDGCGAPAVAIPLRRLALAAAALATDPRLAAVRAAGLANPDLIAGAHSDGSDLVDTALLRAGVAAKRGAEGVLIAGWHDPDGRSGGLAVKALDGSLRGAATAAVAVLERVGAIGPGTFIEPPPTGGGVPVGEIRAGATDGEGGR